MRVLLKNEIMKTLTRVTFVLILIILAACKKENSGSGIIGKWRLTAAFADPGNGRGVWVAIEKKGFYFDYVKFHSNGSLESTIFTDYVTYKLKGSDTVTFSMKDNTIQHYQYTIKNDTMVMSPAGPIMCIEGCGMMFARVR